MKWLPGMILLLGVVVILAGFVYDVLFAGIPYQDPTPELAARYVLHSAVAEAIRGAGGIIFGLGLLALVVARFIFSEGRTSNPSNRR